MDLASVAHRALGRPVLSARVATRTPVVYDPYLSGRTVERVTGTAVGADGESRPWTAIVKRTTGDGRPAAERELSAYRCGVARHDSDDRLSAPVLLAFARDATAVEVWLQELTDEHGGRWATTRYGLAATHIARWDVAMSRTPVPGADVDRRWAQQHGQPHRVAEAVDMLGRLRREAAAQDVMAALQDDGFHRIEAMITSTEARIAALARFPQSLLHHDLVRTNLFAIDRGRTAAIDWENVGPGPLGVDLAPLVVGSVRRGEASSADLDELEHGVLEHYEDALATAGQDPAPVRDAYRLALGLRWHVVLGAVTTWFDPAATRIRGSRPEESRAEGLAHLVALSRHLLRTHR